MDSVSAFVSYVDGPLADSVRSASECLTPYRSLVRRPYRALANETKDACRAQLATVDSCSLSTVCRIFAAIRANPGFSNDAMIAMLTTATGKTMAEMEAGYLAHARAMTAGTAPESVVPATCPA